MAEWTWPTLPRLVDPLTARAAMESRDADFATIRTRLVMIVSTIDQTGPLD